MMMNQQEETCRRIPFHGNGPAAWAMAMPSSLRLPSAVGLRQVMISELSSLNASSLPLTTEQRKQQLLDILQAVEDLISEDDTYCLTHDTFPFNTVSSETAPQQ